MAPASAFSQTEEISDVDVDFVLGLDQRGYLHSPVATLESEGVSAVVREDFEVGEVAAPSFSEGFE